MSFYEETNRTINWFKYRLHDPSLLDRAIFVPHNLGFELAVPVGGKRISGYCWAPVIIAYTIMDEMKLRPEDFPNPRFVLKSQTAGEIRWGEDTKPFWGQRRVLGNMFGYSDKAIEKFMNGDYFFGIEV